MKAVFGLIPDNRLRPVEYAGRDFFAAMRGDFFTPLFDLPPAAILTRTTRPL